MSGPETFGIALRRARQHRGVSLADIAARTNVRIELWEEMERNDFSRWPRGVYARTWIRAYAEIVGLDPWRTVDDFCRWFPQGDRRAASTLREHAEIIGHELAWHDDLTPPTGDRRAVPTVAPLPSRGLPPHQLRLLVAGADLSGILLLVIFATTLLPVGIWGALGVIAMLYYTASLAIAGCTPATFAMEVLARRDPGLYKHGTGTPFRRLPPGEMRSKVANAER